MLSLFKALVIAIVVLVIIRITLIGPGILFILAFCSIGAALIVLSVNVDFKGVEKEHP